MRISNPGQVYFPARGETKLDLVRYYLSVGDGIMRALRERPCMMHRFPSGVAGEKVHQKRVPHGAPPWLETVRVIACRRYPSRIYPISAIVRTTPRSAMRGREFMAWDGSPGSTSAR